MQGRAGYWMQVRQGRSNRRLLLGMPSHRKPLSLRLPTGVVVVFALICAGVCQRSAFAGDSPSATWRDDATLHAVQFVGSRVGYAAGAHGAVWKSSDGGQTWHALETKHAVSLSSVSFLTDQAGFVAGTRIVPFEGLDEGVILATQDGGQSWQSIGQGKLPPVQAIRFFDLETGLASVRPTSDVPSGVVRTSDGGRTWQVVQGVAASPWRAACFLDPELGLVAGAEGRLALIGGEQLLPTKLPPQGLRSVRALTVASDDRGWLAGDGGLVLQTSTGGVVWESPPGSLPDELRIAMDFRAVDARGSHVWIAGSPGSVVWHSADFGRTWNHAFTGQSAPLNAIRFLTDTTGVAVGEFGIILRTEDGGQSWRAVRGGQRRAALLAIQPRPNATAPAWIAKLAGEQGFRSALWVASRQDLGPAATHRDGEAALRGAVEVSGGNASEIYWQLPILVPGLEYSSDHLIADWQKRTEGKLAPSMLSVLVRQLRTWRPTMVVLEQPAPDDAAGQLVLNATLKALEQAADATRYPEQRDLLGLASWNVERVYLQLPTGSAGDATIDLDEYLPRRRMSVRMAAAPGGTILQLTSQLSALNAAQSLAFRWVDGQGRPAPARALARDFHSGLTMPPGSEARRLLDSIDETDLEHLQKLAQRHRNLRAIVAQSHVDKRLANQMVAQVAGMVRDMPSAQGAELLRALVEEYRQQADYELVEATQRELVRRYPNEPAALDAMRWLIQFWSSSETAWQRARKMSTESTRVTGNVSGNATILQQVSDSLARGRGGVDQADFVEPAAPLTPQTRPGRLNRVTLPPTYRPDPDGSQGPETRRQGTEVADWRQGEVREWQMRAADLAAQLETQAPGLFKTPEIQFPLAALQRQKRSDARSDAIFRGFLSRSVDPATRALAEREVWLMLATAETPKALFTCRPTGARPKLDGVLSDECWQNAIDLRLTTSAPADDALEPPSDPESALVMLSYDAEYLYVGLSVPRRPGSPAGNPVAGRTRDADLSRFDRITLSLDVDRDYATWYEFQVDQRGWTSDRCWDDPKWDPTWYVATDADATHWRIEAAIAWSDLVPNSPGRGSVWGLSLVRTTPLVGMQTWVHPPRVRPEPASFGLLKFE